MLVTFHTSSYYDWIPVGDVPLQEGEVSNVNTDGTLVRRVVVPTSTTHESDVNDARIEEIRKELVDNPDAQNRSAESILFRHFEDGVLPFHIPPGTITDVTCSDPSWEPKLRAYFVSQPEQKENDNA